MLRLAGAIGDQVLIGTGLTEEIVEASLRELHQGARQADRDPAELEVWWAPRLSIAETREQAVRNVMASIASAGNHALRSGLAGKYVPEHLTNNLRRFHQEYDYAQHGVKTGKNAQLVEHLGLTEYFLDRFAVAGSPAEIVQRILAAGASWTHQSVDELTGRRRDAARSDGNPSPAAGQRLRVPEIRSCFEKLSENGPKF